MATEEIKEIANVDEEVAALIAKNTEARASEDEGSSIKADYILLAKQGSKALKPKEKELYIDGLKIGEFYVQKQKLNLGDSLKVVPLAFITVYNETDSEGQGARFYGMWNKEQACTYPTVDGSYFNRQLPNGHILVPSNWVMVEVLDHPELTNAVVAYKRTGSRIWKAWKEDAKGRGGSSATMIYTLTEEEYSNDKGMEWTDIGFAYSGNLVEEDKAMAIHCLKKSNALAESYNKHALIANHSEQSVGGTATTAYITDASDVEDSNDSDVLGF